MTTTLLRSACRHWCCSWPASGLSACSSSSDDEPTAGGSTSVDARTASSPFAYDLNGPTEAEPGERIIVTLTNTGRLPDAYQFSIEPSSAATLDEADYRLGAGESVRLAINVKATPFNVRLKSVGGGTPESVALTVN